MMIAAGGSASLHAQDAVPEKKDEKPSITVSGFADAYFRSDFMRTTANNRTSFTHSDKSFELGMASVKLEYSKDKVGLVADLGVGKRAEEFSYNETGLKSAIKQLYVTYQAADWLKFSAGSWATHVGYEVVDAPANRNYSMSYMFSWGPFFHTGLKAEATSGKSTFMLGIANPTDFKTAPANSTKYLLAQYALAASDDVKAYVNYVGGKRFTDSAKTSQFDLVVTAKVNSILSLGYNGTMALNRMQSNNKYEDKSKTWWGSAVYLNLDPSPAFGLTLRTEYFSDRDQISAMSLAPIGAGVLANTLSGNIHLGNLTLIPEFRIESANGSIYSNKSGDARNSDASFLMAAVYRF
jgi:hypothetical protein